jgi:hypothetical protein
MYPTITLDETRRLSEELLRGVEVDLQGSVKWIGGGDEISTEAFTQLRTKLNDFVSSFAISDETDKDAVEAKGSVEVFAAVNELQLEILDDPGFWRYLAMTCMWDFIVWREPRFSKDDEERDWSKYRVYIDGRKNTECVPLRMYLRARIGEIDDAFDLVTGIGAATDLWRSHIVRVRTSYSPNLAQAVLTKYKAERLGTNALRATAKRIQRIASNRVLHLYGADDAASLVEDVWNK